MLKTTYLIWSSLKPILLVIIVLLVIGSTLVAYDQYSTYQERQLGAKLITKIGIESSCDEITSSGEKFSLDFTIHNKNNREVTLERFGIDVNLLEGRGGKFTKLSNTKPVDSESTGSTTQLRKYVFQTPIKFRSNDKKPVRLTMQAREREEAQASPHTIVVYKGTIVFSFNYDISIRSDCRIQVRYP